MADLLTDPNLKFFLLGAFFGLINVLLLAIIVKKLLSGKATILTVFLILSKYCFLGVGLYFLVKNSTNSLPWLIFGLSIFFISVIIYGFLIAVLQKAKTQVER